MRGAALVAIAIACRPPSPPTDGPGGDAAGAHTVAVSAPSISSILGRASELELIVPSDQGPICQRWTVEPSARANGEDRIKLLVQDLQPVESRVPVRLRVEWNDEQITIFDPRARVPGSGEGGASLGGCTSDRQRTACDGYEKQALTPRYDGIGTITTKEGAQLFLDGQACRTALLGGARHEAMICPSVLSRYAAGVDVSPISKQLADVLDRGGKLVRKGPPLTPAHRPIVCETWSILAGARRAFVYKERGKEGCSKFLWTVDVTFERIDNAVLWKGPRFGPNRVAHRCAETPGIGEGTIGCADYLPLIRRGDDGMAIGRDAWYLDRQACERDLRYREGERDRPSGREDGPSGGAGAGTG